MSNPRDLQRADENLPQPFTSAMNAATSRYGTLCDIPITFVVVAAIGTVTAGIHSVVRGLPVWIAPIVLAFPIAVCIGAHIHLRNARQGVLAWLAGVPFPVENVNAILCGSGEKFDVHFRDDPPPRATVMAFFELASNDVFELDRDEERKVVSARFGVMDSKRNPYLAAFRRYERMRRVMELAMVPLHESHAIERVMIV